MATCGTLVTMYCNWFQLIYLLEAYIYTYSQVLYDHRLWIFQGTVVG